MSYGKFVFPSHYLPLPILDVPSPVANSSSHLITCHFLSWTSHLLVNPSSQLIACHFPSWKIHLLVVNLSSHLITCHFPSWTSHLLWQIRLPNSLPATSHLGSPMSCGQFVFNSLPASSHLGRPLSCGNFVFPSHYLPFPILDVQSHVVNSSSQLIACHFPSWKSHVRW